MIESISDDFSTFALTKRPVIYKIMKSEKGQKQKICKILEIINFSFKTPDIGRNV